MISMLFLINALVALGLVILILLQRADTGAGGAFGGGSGSVQPVVRNPLAKPTAMLAAVFLVTSLWIAYVEQGRGHGSSVVTDEHATSEAAPALPSADVGTTGMLVSGTADMSATLPVDMSATQPASPTEAPVTP